MFKLFRHYWEYIVLATTLITLAMFLTGYQLFGLSNHLNAMLSIIGGLLATIASFLLATLFLPLFALITGTIAAFVALITGILSFAVGGIFTPLLAIIMGWVATLFTWLASTWLGTLLMPVYNMVTPLLIKILPWLSATKYGRQIYDWLDDQPWWPQSLVFTGKRTKAKKPTSKNHTKK